MSAGRGRGRPRTNPAVKGANNGKQYTTAKAKRASTVIHKRKPGQRITQYQMQEFEKSWKLGKNKKTMMRDANIASYNTASRWIKRLEAGEPLKQGYSPGRPSSVVTDDRIELLQQFAEQQMYKEHTVSTFHGAFNKHEKQWLKKNKKQARAEMGETAFRRAFRKAGLRSAKGQKKPIGMNCHRKVRLAEALERMKWSKRFLRGVVFVDQACAQRDTAGNYIIPKGAQRPFHHVEDPKNEKFHFMIACSTVWKSPFACLPVRRPTLKDKKGRTVHRTKATGRRAPGTAGKANLPNQGHTWTSAGIIEIVTSPLWLKGLRNATGVVFDAQSRIHAPVIKALTDLGVNCISHPPCSPDFNLCEQAHKHAKARSSQLRRAQNNVQLGEAIEQNWADFDLKDFCKYTDNYVNVMKECIENEGGPTKY